MASTKMHNEYTWVLPTVCVCNACGAFAENESKVEHFPTCSPEKMEHWNKLIKEANDVA